jgi:MFS family permease
MKDVGFTPGERDGMARGVRRIWGASLEYGWHVPAVKWVMLAAPFTAGVGIYAFYALQPYLLELYGDEEAYGIAGLVAAIVAAAQIVGGLTAPWIRRAFARRTSALLLVYAASAASLLLIGLIEHFVVALALISVWGLAFAAASPIRQAFLNGLIPSQQRATILSFDSMLGSSGGVVVQPVLGRSADVWGYPGSYLLGGAISALALPFVWLSRRQNAPADQAVGTPETLEPAEVAAEH